MLERTQGLLSVIEKFCLPVARESPYGAPQCSQYGDIVNSGVGDPGASVGAAFIGSFVDEEQRWAHFDIAGVDIMAEERPTIPTGYSGWGVRTLDEYLRRHHSN